MHLAVLAFRIFMRLREMTFILFRNFLLKVNFVLAFLNMDYFFNKKIA